MFDARSSRWMIAALFGAAAFDAVACNAVFGLDAYPLGTPAEPEGCAGCLEAECVGALRACDEDTECFRLNACLTNCEPNDPVCRWDCVQTNPIEAVDNPRHLALEACRRGTVCFDDCIGVGGLAPVSGGTACEPCLEETCRDTLRGCLEDAGCDFFMGCTTQVGKDNPESILACAYDNGRFAITPERHALQKAIENCWQDCDACGAGTHFSCDYDWGVATSEVSIEVRVQLVDPGSEVAEGATVQACSDRDCALPKTAQVGADGRVVMSVPTFEEGWDGFFRFSGETVEGAAVYPSRLHFGRPITRSEDLVSASIFSAEFVAFLSVLRGFDPTDAHVGLIGLDCLTQKTPGVRFDIEGSDDDTKRFYVLGQDLVLDADGSGTTGSEGAAWLFDVTPSTDTKQTVTMYDGDEPIGGYAMWLVPGEISAAFVFPYTHEQLSRAP